MKKLYFSLLSLMLISVVGFAQVSKPLVSHAKQADASKLYITGSQSMKGGEITTCPANSLFSSAYDAPSSAGTSEVNANGSNYQIATSFQTVGGTIETVHIWMLSMINTGSWATCDGDPMHVNVTFYENNAGAVGDVYATFTDITPTITPANLTLFGSYPVSFMSITLPSSVDLANGFVSVQGTTPSAGTDCWLMWVNAPNGGGTAYQSTDGVWAATETGFTVCLEGTMAACPAPMNFQAINPDLNSIGLSWEQLGDPTAWNIEYGETGFTPTGTPTVSGVTENPYTVTGLDASTSYDFYIQADCGSIWVGPLTAATKACEDATACDYVFNLTDSYGDGWNGNFVTVLQDGIEIAVVTLGAGASGTQSVTLCPALPISLVWNLPAGDSWPGEVGFTLLNPYGEQLATYPATYFASTATGTEIFAFTSDCTPPACPMPTDLTASGITTTGASLGWTEAGSATAWIIEYGAAGFTQGTGTTVTASTNPYALTGLAPATAYAFYVRANCGGADGMSLWAGPFAFATECAIVTTMNEGFEATVPPICWATFQNGAGTQMWASEGTIFNSGAKSAAAYYEGSGGENQQWLVTGQITVPVNHKLTFYTRDYFTTDYLSVLRVLISTDANQNNTGAYTQLIQLAETDVTNANFTQFEIDFSAYAGQNVYIAFVMVDNDGDNWYLDDVKLEPNIGPIAISHLPESNATNVALDATVSVTFNVSVTEVDFTGITITPDPGNVVVSIVDNVLTLAHDAFLYNTEYTVLVPAGAVTDGTNNLVDNVEWSFTTMLDPTACNNPSNLVISDIQEYQAIVSWTENGIGTQWVVIYGSAGFNPTTEGTQVTVDVTTTTLTGLDDNTDYDVYVQAVCGAETSGWAGPAEFTTLLHCDAVATLPFSEDFESGVFPPTCWNVINTHTDANSNWHEAAAQEGFGAEVQYTDAVMMDEWLISPTLDLSAASGDLHISFDFMCSYYWMVDPYDGADLMLKASTDGGATWTELWNEENYGTFENYTYYSVLLPFTAYAGEANVKIAFQFYGNDGAQTIVDNIVIDLGTNIENETINTVSVYPNPSNGLVNINVTENSVISVIDIAGRTVKSFNVKANEEVNFSQSAGLYIIKVESNGKVSTHKLVIQ